jgi:hypothetical protein
MEQVAAQVEKLLAATTLLSPRTAVRYVTRLHPIPNIARQ